MKTRCSVFIACSLDGFIAGSDGSIDWLTSPEAHIDGEDFGYGDFMKTIDAVVLGRTTYELVQTFDAWPYGSRQVYVLSTRYPPDGRTIRESVVGTSANPSDLVQRMSRDSIGRAYIDGGKTIQSFLRDGYIDDMTVTRLPILLGRGIPLFGTLASEVRLEHVTTRSFSNGFVQSVYRKTGGATIRPSHPDANSES